MICLSLYCWLFFSFLQKPDYLTALFTPHVVMVTIVSVFVFVIVAIGLSYYCYRVKILPNREDSLSVFFQLRAENKIAPTDTGSVVGDGEKDGQVKLFFCPICPVSSVQCPVSSVQCPDESCSIDAVVTHSLTDQLSISCSEHLNGWPN